MKLSIIIPMYNVEKYIDQCIMSVLDQDIPKEEYEIIIIDDGSTDDSYNIAKKYLSQNITIIRQKNQGLSVSRNIGVSLAKGDYIFFVDSDDYIATNTINKLIKIVSNYDLDILEFNWRRTKSRELLSSKTEFLTSDTLEVLSGEKFIASRNFHDSVCLYFFKRTFLLNTKVEFIDGRVMEDMIYTAELISMAKRIAYLPLDVYRYVINPNSIWTSKEPNAYRKSIYDFIFMTEQYTGLIEKLENQNVNTTILKAKKKTMLFNIAKRLLRSDLKYAEIKSLIKHLSDQNLFPLHSYKEKNKYRKILIYLFNHKYLFYQTVLFYRIFQTPFEYFVIKKYQKKKELLPPIKK